MRDVVGRVWWEGYNMMDVVVGYGKMSVVGGVRGYVGLARKGFGG